MTAQLQSCENLRWQTVFFSFQYFASSPFIGACRFEWALHEQSGTTVQMLRQTVQGVSGNRVAEKDPMLVYSRRPTLRRISLDFFCRGLLEISAACCTSAQRRNLSSLGLDAKAIIPNVITKKLFVESRIDFCGSDMAETLFSNWAASNSRMECLI